MWERAPPAPRRFPSTGSVDSGCGRRSGWPQRGAGCQVGRWPPAGPMRRCPWAWATPPPQGSSWWPGGWWSPPSDLCRFWQQLPAEGGRGGGCPRVCRNPWWTARPALHGRGVASRPPAPRPHPPVSFQLQLGTRPSGRSDMTAMGRTCWPLVGVGDCSSEHVWHLLTLTGASGKDGSPASHAWGLQPSQVRTNTCGHSALRGRYGPAMQPRHPGAPCPSLASARCASDASRRGVD